jgi:hypothetical protein
MACIVIPVVLHVSGITACAVCSKWRNWNGSRYWQHCVQRSIQFISSNKHRSLFCSHCKLVIETSAYREASIECLTIMEKQVGWAGQGVVQTEDLRF